jgi:hypothetical protein
VSILIERYRDDILQPYIVIDRQMQMAQKDNARSYTARVIMDFLAKHTINPLPWPSKSPVLTPLGYNI